MPKETIYSYSLPYKFNFVPGVILFLVILTFIVNIAAANKIYLYLTVGILFSSFIILSFLEKKKVAYTISFNDDGLFAKRILSSDIFIKWKDIKNLRFSGYGRYLHSGNIVKYLYAEVIEATDKRIIIRREIRGYDELIREIENKSGKVFQETVS